MAKQVPDGYIIEFRSQIVITNISQSALQTYFSSLEQTEHAQYGTQRFCQRSQIKQCFRDHDLSLFIIPCCAVNPDKGVFLLPVVIQTDCRAWKNLIFHSIRHQW